MVFRTIGIYVITSTFFYVFFQNPKSRDFLRFLPCFVRFLELCLLPPIAEDYGLVRITMIIILAMRAFRLSSSVCCQRVFSFLK